MKGKHHFLSGLHNDHHKAAIGSLIDEGWKPARTGSGHIRLTHPDAGRPIYASSTPSDRNAGSMLKRDAARVLRMSTIATQPHPTDMFDPIHDLVSKVTKNTTGARTGTSKRKQRWTEGERIARDAAKLMIKHYQEAKIDGAKPTKATQIAAKDLKLDPKAVDITTEHSKDTPLAIAPEEFKVIEASALPVTAVRSVALEVEQDLLETAMKIVSGHYSCMEITADMVGGYLLIEGDAFLAACPVESRDIYAAHHLVLEGTTEAKQEDNKRILPAPITRDTALEQGNPRAVVLGALIGMKACGGTCRDIAEAIYDDPTHAQMEGVRHQLQKLIRDGQAKTERRGRIVAYIATNIK